MGTSRRARAANSPYGSFGNTKIKKITNAKVNQHAKVNKRVKVNNQHVKLKNENEDEDDTTDDVDSGMSSEENEDSLKSNLSPKVSNLSSIVDDKQDVITKCLIIEPQCVELGNVIPSCSNDVNVIIEDESRTRADNTQANEKVSEFIVIDLTCDVEDVSEMCRSETDVAGTNSFECDDPSDSSVECLSLVPVANNEIARRENQKLLSLSLSILLAALLQAMRCFAQFLEDIIVIPHR